MMVITLGLRVMPRDTCCGLSLSFLLTTAAMTVGKVHMIGPKSSTSSSMVDGVSARMRASVQVSYVFKGWSRTVITIYDDDELFLNAQGSRHTTHAKCFASLAELMKEKDRISVRNSKLSCALSTGRGIKSVVKEEVWQNLRYALFSWSQAMERPVRL